MVTQLRKLMPYLFVATLAAVAYDGWFFFSRWRDNREAERLSRVAEAEAARKTIDMMGGGQLKIANFYASPSTIRRGQHANLCYGVYGAKSVRIQPAVEELHPAISRCFPVSPEKSTEYQLVAQDASGHTTTRELTLQVVP